MTEEEWLITTDDRAMLLFDAGKMGPRKTRLFLAAFARKMWRFLCCDFWREAVSSAEDYSDLLGLYSEASRSELERRILLGRWRPHLGDGPMRDFSGELIDPSTPEHSTTLEFLLLLLRSDAEQRTLDLQPIYLQTRKRYHGLSHLLRDIVGNPFRPVAFDPKWQTEHTIGIAGKMYDERDFRAMPILADALEEAGCDNPDILTHCRQPGTHVRGCWVVDLVLGKS